MLTDKMIARITRTFEESDGTPLFVVSYALPRLKAVTICLSEKQKGDVTHNSHDAIICTLPTPALVKTIREMKREVEIYLKGLSVE